MDLQWLTLHAPSHNNAAPETLPRRDERPLAPSIRVRTLHRTEAVCDLCKTVQLRPLLSRYPASYLSGL